MIVPAAAELAMPKIVGLTGGIATGKSTVSRIWREAGVPIIDADEVSREVVKPGRTALRLIRWNFGKEIIKPDGSLDRPALGRIIFSNPAKRRRLNMIMHPFIISSMIRKLLYVAVFRFEPVIVLDTPLLFESGTLVPICGATVVVACNEDQQLERLLRRASENEDSSARLTEREASERIASQMALDTKIARATHVLDNAGSFDSLERDSRILLEELRPSPAGELVFRGLLLGIAAKLAVSIAFSLAKATRD